MLMLHLLLLKLIIKRRTLRSLKYMLHIGNGSCICFKLQIKIKLNTICVATQLNWINIIIN